MNEVKKMSLSVMTTELSTSEMEMIQAGSGWGCVAGIGLSTLLFVARAATGGAATVVGAAWLVGGWYGSMLTSCLL